MMNQEPAATDVGKFFEGFVSSHLETTFGPRPLVLAPRPLALDPRRLALDPWP